MRWVLNIVGVLIILTGSTFFLQGVGILPGSYMSGQTQWAYIGSVTVLIGIGLLALANRRRKNLPPAA